jgi:SAM-dependent methyltransferase
MTFPIAPSDPSGQETSSQERVYWGRSHGQLDYADVFSVTEDPILRARIEELIRRYHEKDGLRIIVPGCGSRTVLEQHLVSRFHDADIVGSDFEEVVAVAASRFADARVSYVAEDTRNLNYEQEFDFAVVVNSILSDVDEDNRKMVGSICKALRRGGILIGLFPTVFASADLAYCDPREEDRLKLVNLRTSRFFEESQELSQIFYTPLRLNAIIQEAGLERICTELFFCDSDVLRREAKRIYGIEGEFSVIYELLVIARRP